MRKKVIVISIIICLLIILVGILFKIYNENRMEELKINTVSMYFKLLNEQKYDEMYKMLVPMNMSEEDFIKRNKNIYDGIDAVNIVLDVIQIQEDTVMYNQKMFTSAGNIEFSNKIDLKKDGKGYKIYWNSNLIFPELNDNYKVKVTGIEGKRGEILDRNGEKLAYNGKIYIVGIVPGKLLEKEVSIKAISELTGVSEEYINKQLSSSWVKEDSFVPVKKISMENIELKDKLLEIKGIMLKTTEARVYALGEEACHIVGYVQTINADELKAKEGKGYSSTSIIGKAGIEQRFEETLRAIDGKEIYIVDEDGNKIKTLAMQEKIDGKDVKLTLDKNYQKSVYEQMKNDRGLFVVMEPKTGAIIACVSTPSYNSNDFVLGITNDKWEELNNNPGRPLYSKFLQSYCPGSTFKPITAAIGLATGKLTENTSFNYSGLSWQKDDSWKTDYITTLTSYSGIKNIRNALIHSDNIFFAQAAMQIGIDTFEKELNNIAFNDEIDFELGLKKSQFSNTEKGITSEKKLADSGFRTR